MRRFLASSLKMFALGKAVQYVRNRRQPTRNRR
jgi:hypothetical protein